MGDKRREIEERADQVEGLGIEAALRRSRPRADEGRNAASIHGLGREDELTWRP